MQKCDLTEHSAATVFQYPLSAIAQSASSQFGNFPVAVVEIAVTLIPQGFWPLYSVKHSVLGNCVLLPCFSRRYQWVRPLIHRVGNWFSEKERGSYEKWAETTFRAFSFLKLYPIFKNSSSQPFSRFLTRLSP